MRVCVPVELTYLHRRQEFCWLVWSAPDRARGKGLRWRKTTEGVSGCKSQQAASIVSEPQKSTKAQTEAEHFVLLCLLWLSTICDLMLLTTTAIPWTNDLCTAQIGIRGALFRRYDGGLEFRRRRQQPRGQLWRLD